MDKVRIFQLIEILRRVRTNEMAKLKYSTNFGVSVEIIDFIVNDLYTMDVRAI